MRTAYLDQLCRAFHGRLRRLLVQAGIARVIALAFVLPPVIFVLDWWLHLDAVVRLLALLIYLAAVGVTAWWTLVLPLRRVWTPKQILSYLDTVLPESRGMLLDLYELVDETEVKELESPVGRELGAAAIEDLSPIATQVRIRKAFWKTTRWTVAAAAVVMLVVGAAIPLRDHVRIGLVRLFAPFWTTKWSEWPHRTNIVLVPPPNGWVVPQREPFRLKVLVDGEVPPNVVLAYRGEGTGYWIREKLPVAPIEVAISREEKEVYRGPITSVPADVRRGTVALRCEGQPSAHTVILRGKREAAPPVLSYNEGDGEQVWDFLVRGVLPPSKTLHTFPEVQEGLRVYAEGGDYRTDTVRINVLARPYLKPIIAHYKYPRYARIPDKTVEGGQLSGLEGTKVGLEFESSMPLKKAVLVVALRGQEEKTESLPLRTATKFVKDLELIADGYYVVQLYEVNGFREARPEKYEIVVTPDNKPEVEILAPGRDLSGTKQASFDMAFEARDDFGLKSVEVLYQIDNGPLTALPSKVTGPIEQTGRLSRGRFTWDFRKMDGVPEQGNLAYFVRARDINPSTGRKPVDSGHYSFKLIKRRDYQLDEFERAKGLLTEARIAWREQLEAWKAGLKWTKEGTGKEDDAAWRTLEDHQEVAIRAGRALQGHMEQLASAYTTNHMEAEFMAPRLNVIAGYIHRLVEREHSVVESAMRDARPKTATEAEPEQLKQKRTGLLAKCKDNQKMSMLVIDRVLRMLYDWRDLQFSSVTAGSLHERQQEALEITRKIAPKYIGKDILDLTDKEQEDLLTLGKRQRGIFDTETELERQFSDMMQKAEVQNRKLILVPLSVAFKLLRDNRVNDNLKQAAMMIENNQPYQIVKNQEAALWVLDVVMRGLVLAGQKVDIEPDLDLAMEIKEDTDREVEVKPVKPPDEPILPPERDPLRKEIMDKIMIELIADPVSATIRLSVEAQDNVLARTRFLGENLSPDDMPRFRRLTRGILEERQDTALTNLDRAQKTAEEKKSGVVREVLSSTDQEFRQFRQLISRENYSKCTQQMQTDTIDLLKDVLELFLPMQKSASDVVKENKAGDGIDFSKRPWVLRGKDLDTTSEMLTETDYARVIERDVVRKLDRFAKQKPADPVLEDIEKTNRARTAAAQKKVATLAQTSGSKSNALTPSASYVRTDDKGKELWKKTWDVGPEVKKAAAVDALAALELGAPADEILLAKKDPELVPRLGAAAQVFAGAVRDLRDLLDKRIEPPEAPRVDAATIGPTTIEDIKRETSPGVIAGRLEKNPALPEELVKRMRKALEIKEFSGKYKDLLAAYYSSFAAPEVVEK